MCHRRASPVPRTLYFISHPNVVIDRSVPVPRWRLSDLGRQRMALGLRQPWIASVSSIYSSTEQKAIDGAEILAAHLKLRHTQIDELGENDRSSTGFLPPAEFEVMANAFFENPSQSVKGWERAVDAQARILNAMLELEAADDSTGSIAIVSHGAVGTLLYCSLAGKPISRRWDQPPNGGGNYYAFQLSPRTAHSHWQAFDQCAA
jgi:broad specificity phosphatase PhoE